MNEAELDSVLGQLQALSIAISSIAASLPEDQALVASQKILGSILEQKIQDEEDGVSEESTRTKYLILDSYSDLLQSVAGLA